MKKTLGIVLGVALLAACNSSENQSAEVTTDSSGSAVVTVDTNIAAPPVTVQYTEGDVMLKEGKTYVYTNGNWVVAEKEIKLDNGIVIAPNGEVKNKDGKVVVLEEGEYVNKSGNFFDRTGVAVENAWDKTKDAAQKAASATKEGVEKGVEATKDAAHKTGEAIKKGAQKVGDKTKEIVEDIKK